jgi:hypothetical protein
VKESRPARGTDDQLTRLPHAGVDFLEKALFVDALAEEVRFMLWDTGAIRADFRCFEHQRSRIISLQLDKRSSMHSREPITVEQASDEIM